MNMTVMLPNYTEYCGTCTVLLLHHDVNQLKQRHRMEQSIIHSPADDFKPLYEPAGGGHFEHSVYLSSR